MDRPLEPQEDAPAPLRRLAATQETIAVTGATGWFGRVTLDLLATALGPEAFGLRVTSYASRSREIAIDGVGPVVLLPLSDLEPADVLLHYAFVTRTRVTPAELDGFVRANAEITTSVLAAVATGRVRRLLVTSSGAATHGRLVHDPYGVLKALDELAFPEACRRVGTTCVIARVFNVGGAHMSRPEAYALGDLILKARAGQPLTIAARGDIVRSYSAVRDIVAVSLGELLDGRDAFFETAGERPVEIEELARAVLSVLGREDLAILRERDPQAAPSVYVGDGTRLGKLAQRHGITLAGLEAVVAETAAGLL